jgi:NitT/TauT family transport system substrate-binding protein
VRVQLQWFHQAQFAGLYVADALGFYEREGIAVDFIQGGTMIEGVDAINPLTVLSLGGADVAIAWLSNALTHRRNGGDIVNIAQVFRRPATALVCWRDAGIRSPAELRGRTIGVWNVGDQYQVAEWLRQHGVGASEVSIVPQRADARDLIERKLDCGTVMTFNEYWTLFRSGISPGKLYIVRFADEGSGLLEDGVYATGGSLADPVKRERLVRFLRASAAGWRYAREHPEEALNITLIQTPLADPVQSAACSIPCFRLSNRASDSDCSIWTPLLAACTSSDRAPATPKAPRRPRTRAGPTASGSPRASTAVRSGILLPQSATTSRRTWTHPGSMLSSWWER